MIHAATQKRTLRRAARRLILGITVVSVLTFGLTLVPAGRLGDEYGRRRLFLIGLSLFAATAIICGLVDPRMKIEIEVTARRADASAP